MKVYEKKSFPRRSQELVKMHKDGKLTFDNAVQRNLGWNDKQKSLLIHSMIIDFPIPPMYCNCQFEDSKCKVYDFLDGKQRTLGAIIPFLKDEFALIGVPVINTDENSDDDDSADPEKLIDVNGLKYSELSEEFRDKVKNYSLTVYYYENMTQDDAEEMISRLNNGKSFTAIELTRIKAKSLDTIKEIGKHGIFNSALTEKAMNKYTNEDIVIKSWVILNSENPSFETKQIRPILESAEITPEQAEVITTVYDKVLETYTTLTGTGDKQDAKVAKRLITRTHLVSIMPIVAKLIANDTWNTEKFTAWTRKFFAGTKSATISEIYNESARNSSGKVESVKKRLNAVNDDYNAFAWVIIPKTKVQSETEQQEVKPIKHEDVLSIINEVMNETPNTNDSANISENTNSKIETEELGNELENDTVLGEDDAETLPDTSDTSENEEIAGDNAQDDDSIEIKELTIDDIPETEGLEEQAS